MNSRVSSSASLALHAVLIAALASLTIDQRRPLPEPPGMELELIDLEHAMPLPDPVLAQEEAAADVPEVVQSDPVIAPKPPAPQPVPPAPRPISPSQTAPQPVAKPEPRSATPPVEVKQQLGVGPVAPLPRPVVTANPATAVVRPQVAAAPPAAPPSPPRPRLDSGSLSRMLAAKAGPSPRPARINSAAIGSAVGRAAPRGAASLTVRQRTNLEDMIRSQITPCWNPPVAEDASTRLVVVMRIKLDRSGALNGSPTVSAVKGQTDANAAYGRALAGSVRRAVMRCAPLKLPPELHEAWADVELNFDPRDIS